MQDLGRIVIDINEKGSAKAEGISGIGSMAGSEGGGGAAAVEEIGGLAEVASTAASAFTVVVGAFAALAKVVGKVGEALMALNRFVMEVANDLHDYSPGIQLAEMQNQIAMVSTKFRMGMQYGGAIGAQMLEAGRIERSFIEIKSAFGAIGAIFLRPITKYVADLLDYVKTFIPAIAEALARFGEALASAAETRQSMVEWLAAKMSYVWNGQQGYDISMATRESSPFAKLLKEMAQNLRALKRNTDPKIDYGAMNEPFFQDLRLMGVKGI
jgi:hypothetical protein